MTGSPPVIIERTAEVAMKVHLKAKEMGEHVQPSLCKQKYLFFIYHTLSIFRIKARTHYKIVLEAVESSENLIVPHP